MKSSHGRKLFLRSLCLLLICNFGIGQCACDCLILDTPTSGTIYSSIGTDKYSLSARIASLRSEAEWDFEYYLEEYNNEWYSDKNNNEIRSDLNGTRIIGASEYQYIGYCFFEDRLDSYGSSIYYIYLVTVVDSTGEESLTRSFYLLNEKGIDRVHNSPCSFVPGSEKIDFSSFSEDGYTSLDSVIEMIKKETGRNDISKALHLEASYKQYKVSDPVSDGVAYKNQIVVLFQEKSRVYAVFMKEGKPDYTSPVLLSKDWFKPEVLEKAKFGTILSMYYDGERIETYPLQVNHPLSFTYVGQIEESEQEDLKKAEQELRDSLERHV